MNPKGGTEILKEQLIAQLEPGSIDGINLIGSITCICHHLLKKIKIEYSLATFNVMINLTFNICVIVNL
jgi:hypothetical protein